MEKKTPKVKIRQMVGWEWCKEGMLRTVALKPKTPQPTKEQKLRWLIAEHAPIKIVQWWIDIEDLRQWVGVHLIRHPFIIPMISSQRSDKVADKEAQIEAVLSYIKDDIVNDPDFDKSQWRDYRLQGSTNGHSFVVNAQTLINISRKRLCRQASTETREVWELVKDCMEHVDAEMASVMVPNCVYRGWCPEMTCCGYCIGPKFDEELKRYRGLIPDAKDRLKKRQ